MRKGILVGALAGLAALIGSSIASTAFASVAVYTSQTAFDAANPSAVTYGFDASGEITVIANPSTFNGVTFTDETTSQDEQTSQVPMLFLIDSVDISAYGVDFLSYQNQDTNIAGQITPTNTNFFGFTYGSYFPNGEVVTLGVTSGGATSPYTVVPSSAGGFIGFSSTSPITDITIDDPGAYAFDVINYSTVSPAPEPAAWLMMMIGVGVVGAALRRRTLRGQSDPAAAVAAG